MNRKDKLIRTLRRNIHTILLWCFRDCVGENSSATRLFRTVQLQLFFFLGARARGVAGWGWGAGRQGGGQVDKVGGR